MHICEGFLRLISQRVVAWCLQDVYLVPPTDPLFLSLGLSAL